MTWLYIDIGEKDCERRTEAVEVEDGGSDMLTQRSPGPRLQQRLLARDGQRVVERESVDELKHDARAVRAVEAQQVRALPRLDLAV